MTKIKLYVHQHLPDYSLYVQTDSPQAEGHSYKHVQSAQRRVTQTVNHPVHSHAQRVRTHNRTKVTIQYIPVFHTALLNRSRCAHAHGYQFFEMANVSALAGVEDVRR